MEESLPLRGKKQICAKSKQFKTDCNSLREKLNSFGKTRKCDFFGTDFSKEKTLLTMLIDVRILYALISCSKMQKLRYNIIILTIT